MFAGDQAIQHGDHTDLGGITTVGEVDPGVGKSDIREDDPAV